MNQKYTRILQRHGTSSEIHFPPEACKKLNAAKGDKIEFELSPYDNKVTLRKAGTSEEQPRPLSIMLGDNICIIFGKPDSGKTELAKTLYKNRSRFIVYDNTGKHIETGVTFENRQSLKDFLYKVHRHNFRIIYQPTHPKNEFDSICKLVNLHKGDRPLTFVIENLDLYCEPNISAEFSKLIENGSDNEIQLICTTLRPDQIDKRLTRQIKQIFELRILAERLILNALNNDDYH